MNAYSIFQDEADAIASGKQTLIAVSWATHIRGELLLIGVESIRQTYQEPHAGTATCIVRVLGCREMTPADEGAARVEYRDHRVVWELDKVVMAIAAPFRFDQCRRLIYDVPDQAVEASSVRVTGLPPAITQMLETFPRKEGFPDINPTPRKRASAKPTPPVETGGLFG